MPSRQNWRRKCWRETGNFIYFTFFTFFVEGEIRTVRISSKRQITIPKAFSAFKEGSRALVLNEGDRMIVKPLPKGASEIALLSEAALAECWNSPEDEEAFEYLQ